MTFGPRVIGQEQFEREQAFVESGAVYFGNKVVAPPVLAQEPQEEPVEKSKRRELTAEAVKDVLRREPEAFDTLFAEEFKRSAGPRATALREFLAFEIKRPGGPRAEVIKRIEEGLG